MGQHFCGMHHPGIGFRVFHQSLWHCAGGRVWGEHCVAKLVSVHTGRYVRLYVRHTFAYSLGVVAGREVGSPHHCGRTDHAAHHERDVQVVLSHARGTRGARPCTVAGRLPEHDGRPDADHHRRCRADRPGQRYRGAQPGHHGRQRSWRCCCRNTHTSASRALSSW